MTWQNCNKAGKQRFLVHWWNLQSSAEWRSLDSIQLEIFYYSKIKNIIKVNQDQDSAEENVETLRLIIPIFFGTVPHNQNQLDRNNIHG